ncbi:CaiB/BaiF CoA transferase family protein [Minwuia sp.]|uniref:CaiB/BaiF CoA transferase family protein n=1 Tax=Minwuia sp. TaxID=2493630 RepID=UPI003A8DA28F
MGALNGLKVIDLTRVLGGPYCAQILADHGANVIKLEPPQGDEVRDWGPPFKGGLSAYFSGVNRNKRSLGLDLGKPEGRDVLMTLLEGADVLMENFKPGSLEKWGIGYHEVLSKRFPKLVHCQISGFGGNGPFGGQPGYDAAIQAWTGLISVNGTEESGPVRLGIPLVDLGTGLYSAIGILSALYERQTSGLGQYIEATLYDCGFAMQHPHAPNFFQSGNAPKLTGNAHPNIYPYDLFPTRGRGVFLAVGNDRQFHRLMEILGRPEIADDPRFIHNPDRSVNRAELATLLTELCADWDGTELATLLLKSGVPAGAALTVPDVAAHPHTLAREMVVSDGDYQGTGIPVKLSRTPGSVRSIPPKFGEHGREILREAGLDDDAIDKLYAAGIALEQRRQ